MISACYRLVPMLLAVSWIVTVHAEPTVSREAGSNPFAKKSWRPPERPHKAAASAPPEAPALELTFFGRFIDENGKLMIFLKRADGKIFLVSQGSKLDEAYRVESIQNDSVQLRYLPLNVLQTLRMNGGAS